MPKANAFSGSCSELKHTVTFEQSKTSTSGPTERSVAVVDDEPEVRSTFSRLISYLGYGTATLFEDGNSFCDAVTKNAASFEVVLMDYRMPGMNGIEAAKVVKKCSPNTKIILVTGYDSIKEAAVAEGLMYLQKPFSIKALKNTLKQAPTGSAKAMVQAEVPDVKQERPNEK